MPEGDAAVGLQGEARRDVLAAERVVADGGLVADGRAAILDPQHAGMAAVPRRIVAAAIADPQHGDRQLARVLEDEQQIAFGGARHRRPSRALVIGLDQDHEILVAGADGIDGEIE